MAKKYVEVRICDKVVAVSEIKECEPLTFIELQKAAKENAKEIQDSLFKAIETQNARIRELEKEIRILKGED